MTVQINGRLGNILTISTIACISALVFVFHQAADMLSFQCLKTAVANTAFGTMTICAEGVTNQKWQIVSDYSVLIVVAFPCITYIIARGTNEQDTEKIEKGSD